MKPFERVLLVGATGNLGGLIAQAILDKPFVKLRCLIRPGSETKVAGLVAKGAEIVLGDVSAGSEEVLRAACQGVDTVVSAVQGGPDVIIEGQSRLLRAAEAEGVRRFLPSDFSFDFLSLDPGANLNSDWRRAFAEIADASPLEVVHVLCSCFLDKRVLFGFLGALVPQAGEAYLWGDGDIPMDFTTYDDTARITAEIAVDPSPVPRRFGISGDKLDFAGLVAAYEEASGKKIKVVKKGSLADMDIEIDRLVKADPMNFNAFLPLMYWRAMLNGRATVKEIENGRYPHLALTTVREYVAREGL